MANVSLHILEYRTSPQAPPPPDQPAPITAPLEPPNTNSTMATQNHFNRSVGLGQVLDIIG